MNEQQIRQLVTQMIQADNSASRFQLTPVQSHTHDDINSPITFQPIIPYGCIVNGNGSAIPGYPFPQGWTVSHGNHIISFTTTVAASATSATLSTPWTDVYFQNLLITFSTGEQQYGTFTVGSTTVTWGAGLTNAASPQASTSATGAYYVVHNLNTKFYSPVANPINDATLFAHNYAVSVSPSANAVGVFISDTSTQSLVDVPFSLVLVQINNKKDKLPLYNNQ